MMGSGDKDKGQPVLVMDKTLLLEQDLIDRQRDLQNAEAGLMAEGLGRASIDSLREGMSLSDVFGFAGSGIELSGLSDGDRSETDDRLIKERNKQPQKREDRDRKRRKEKNLRYAEMEKKLKAAYRQATEIRRRQGTKLRNLFNARRELGRSRRESANYIRPELV